MLWCLYVDVTFTIIIVVNFYKMETICFNMICQLSYLFAMKAINFALCSIFQSSLQSTHF
jgi:hypothetical protein